MSHSVLRSAANVHEVSTMPKTYRAWAVECAFTEVKSMSADGSLADTAPLSASLQPLQFGWVRQGRRGRIAASTALFASSLHGAIGGRVLGGRASMKAAACVLRRATAARRRTAPCAAEQLLVERPRLLEIAGEASGVELGARLSAPRWHNRDAADLPEGITAERQRSSPKAAAESAPAPSRCWTTRCRSPLAYPEATIRPGCRRASSTRVSGRAGCRSPCARARCKARSGRSHCSANGEMRQQPRLARAVVIRRHEQRRIGAEILGHLHVP